MLRLIPKLFVSARSMGVICLQAGIANMVAPMYSEKRESAEVMS